VKQASTVHGHSVRVGYPKVTLNPIRTSVTTPLVSATTGKIQKSSLPISSFFLPTHPNPFYLSLPPLTIYSPCLPRRYVLSYLAIFSVLRCFSSSPACGFPSLRTRLPWAHNPASIWAILELQN
jgi:hypothetical protein